MPSELVTLVDSQLDISVSKF